MTQLAAAPGRAAAAVAAATGAVVAFDPLHRHVPLCPLHALTGLQCPFCGGLRAVDALAHGDVGQAARFNLLLVLAIPLVLAYWTAWLLGHRPRPGRPAAAAAITAAVLFTIVRNL